MTTGRKPTPTEARIRRGESPRTTPVVVAGRKVPATPSWLNARQRRIWDQIVEDLAAGQAIDLADWPVVEALTVAIDRGREAGKLVNKEGLLGFNSQGRVAHPALGIEERARKESRQLAEQLPMSPIGRTRLGLMGGKGQADNGLEAELGGASPRLRALRGGQAAAASGE